MSSESTEEKICPALPPLPPSVSAGRLPVWDLDRLVHRACPVCGRDEFEYVCRRPDGLWVATCRRCTMVYLPRIPDTAQVARFYQSYRSFKGISAQRLPPRQCERLARTNEYIAILRNSGGLLHRSLIELGCSTGSFLQVARTCGARVLGVDLDDEARAHLQTVDIQARKQLQGDKTADVICAFQLLEHLEHPSALIETISQVLVEDGRLLVAVPNGGEWEDVGESWIGFRVDLEHLNYFGVKSLSRLLGLHNIFVEQFWLHAQPAIVRGEGETQPKPGLWHWLTGLPSRLVMRPDRPQSLPAVLLFFPLSHVRTRGLPPWPCGRDYHDMAHPSGQLK